LAEGAEDTSQTASRWRLPRRDYILLPLIFPGTILVLLAGGEITARLLALKAQDDAGEPCGYATPAGERYHAGCTSWTKEWEGPWTSQHFNEYGYRTAESCALRPPGSLRVAVVGSSAARGVLVNYPDSFAARASAFLSDRCGGWVDFQNLGTVPPDVDRIDQRIPEALALKLAAIVMTIGPYDLIHLKDPPPSATGQEPQKRLNLRSAVTMLRESRRFLLTQHYLYRDPAFQIRAFLLNGDPADYVRRPLSPLWHQRVEDLGDLLRRITAETSPAGVPVALVYVPERAQAAMAAMKSEPPGVDPFVLTAALDDVARRNEVRFLDGTPAFADAPDFYSLYYLTEGHLRDGGHAALASVVEQGLLAERAFARCRGYSQATPK
jgi:hypothetical protein